MNGAPVNGRLNVRRSTSQDRIHNDILDLCKDIRSVLSTKYETAKPKHEVRTWTSADGTKTLEAKFKYRGGGTVVLEKPDGTEIKVAFDKLSKDDQDYARGNKAKATGGKSD
jgi:SLA1 Homology Domain 1 (SHD1) protein